MATPKPWWQTPLAKGLTSLAIALAITFMPMGINRVRAMKRATVIEVIASPAGAVTDSLGPAK